MRMELTAPKLKRIVPCSLVAAAALTTVVLAVSLFSAPTPPKLEALLNKYAPAEQMQEGGDSEKKTDSPKPKPPKPSSADSDRVKRTTFDVSHEDLHALRIKGYDANGSLLFGTHLCPLNAGCNLISKRRCLRVEDI